MTFQILFSAARDLLSRCARRFAFQFRLPPLAHYSLFISNY
ncbi:hypothetical protein BN2364_3807 [Alloalcanivorax xenomutans]|nr:hypothetical protein BN2364_3807 [Alloalcanivorax xenomutans]